VLAGVVHRGIEQRLSDALPARLAADDEAHDRPHRLVVDPGQNGRVLEALVVRSRAKAHPADRFTIPVGHEAGGAILGLERTDRALHHGAVPRDPILSLGRPALAGTVERAPAIARISALAEERGKVR
jgi:hypothetical protein